MNFYLTLPSNASKDLYSKNTQSNFTVQLNPPLRLNGKYEVALTDITYSSKIVINLGKMIIPNPMTIHSSFTLGRDLEIIYEFFPSNMDNVSDYFSNLNTVILNQIVTTELTFRNNVYYTILNQLNNITQEKYDKIRNAHIQFHGRTHDPRVIEYSLKTSKSTKYYIIDSVDCNNKEKYTNAGFIFNDKLQVYESSENKDIPGLAKEIVKINEPDKYDVEEFFTTNPNSEPIDETHKQVHEELMSRMVNDQAKYKRHLGVPVFSYIDTKLIITYSDVSTYNRKLRFEGLINNLLNISHIESGNQIVTYFPDTFNMIRYGLVYIDIIDDQYYGDTTAPILNTVIINPENQTKSFIDPHYVPVNKSMLNSINIRILDTFGEPIKFQDIFSFVIVKLHFRRS